MTDLIFGVSLLAAFLGGVLALFAPCCITFLFPSYLGTIFKQKDRVVFLTFIFALGLGAVLVPVALGARIIVNLFDQYHTTVYLVGAGFLFVMGIMTLFEVKFFFPMFSYEMPKKTTVFSTFVLGVFSGITSACCAPVLFAAMTLSALSATFLKALIVTGVYVAGIVAPLFFISLFWEKITNAYLFKVKKTVGSYLKIVSSFIFMFSAVIIAYFALTGRINIDENMKYGSWLRSFVYDLSSRFSLPVFDLLILIVIILFFIFLGKEVYYENKRRKDKDNDSLS